VQSLERSTNSSAPILDTLMGTSGSQGRGEIASRLGQPEGAVSPGIESTVATVLGTGCRRLLLPCYRPAGAADCHGRRFRRLAPVIAGTSRFSRHCRWPASGGCWVETVPMKKRRRRSRSRRMPSSEPGPQGARVQETLTSCVQLSYPKGSLEDRLVRYVKVSSGLAATG
jgi:hypothetical protein